MSGLRLIVTVLLVFAVSAAALVGLRHTRGATDETTAAQRRALTRRLLLDHSRAPLGDARYRVEVRGGAGSAQVQVRPLEAWEPVGRLHLRLDETSQPPAPAYETRERELTGDAGLDAYLGELEERLTTRDDGVVATFGRRLGPFWHSAQAWSALAALLVWFLVIVVWRRTGLRASVRFRTTHFVALSLQAVFLFYWGLHWSWVGLYLPVLVGQAVFAYGVDMLLAFSTRGRWTATFAPLPVVGSTSLFVWFGDAHSWLGFAAIFVALASKVLVRRDGRHVFNPSGIGITVIAIPCLLWPDVFRYIDISRELNLPPNMAEVIFLFGFIAQRAVPVVLISLASYVVMTALIVVGLVTSLSPFWPAVFLALVLLATDPSTSPRTGVGRVLFGAFFGAGIVFFDALLAGLGASTFFAKVLPLPAANWLVPWFDRVGASAPEAARRLFDRSRDRRHVIAWAVVVVLTFVLLQPKRGAMLPDLHALYESPLYTVDRERREWTPDLDLDALCAEQSHFCTSFGFWSEGQAWARRR